MRPAKVRPFTPSSIVRNSSSCAGSITLALWLLLSAGCAQQAGVVPSPDVMQWRPRIVSSRVSAGGRAYVIDQMYAPSANNLEGITPGPHGNIWFTSDYPALVKSSITSDMFELPIPGYGNATSIVKGPDQNLWVTLYPAAIGRMSTNGRFTAFPISPKFGPRSNPFSITNGPDKALWFVTNSYKSYIVRVTLSGAMKGYRVPAGAKLQWLTFGADGNLWFTDAGTNKIGRMSASGVVKEFSVPTPSAGLYGICQGPDGNLWFVETSANKVGSVSASGSFHEYSIPTPYSVASAIVAGPDGALWFTETMAGRIGRITTSGHVVELKLSGAYPRPLDIAVGSDGNIWFTETESYGIVGRVDLNEVKGSDPIYSEIAFSLGKDRPELGVPKKLPLSVTVYNLAHHVVSGRYPNPIHLTTSDSKQAALSQTVVTSSTSRVSVLFSGHYTDADIGANAAGGGTIQPAIVLPSTQREKKIPAPGYGLTAGPNDSVWICLEKGSIASYSMNGAVHVYHATTSFTEEGCSMVEGPDGNVWFTDYSNNRIGTITPLGRVTFFPLGSEASPFAIALGSDGALWFTESFPDEIGRLTVGGQLTTFKTAATPYDIVAGPDGDLWFNDSSDNIYKMTTGGRISLVRNVYRLGASLWAAFDNIWFYDTLNEQLDEMSTRGTILKKYPVPNGCIPFGLTSGPENSIWYVDSGNDCAARMTLLGKFSVVPTYSQKENPGLFTGIVVGPNGDLWFTETGNKGLGWIDPTTI
jgi:virginiamycin B lyase